MVVRCRVPEVSPVLTAAAHRADKRHVGVTVDIKRHRDPPSLLRLVFRPQVGHSETAKAPAGSYFTSPACTPGDRAKQRRVVQIGTHSSQSPACLPTLMDGSLWWGDNAMEDGENFGLLWRI